MSARHAAARRYRAWPNLYYYAHGKIALDPAYPASARLLADSSHPLLDLGCGMGLLAAYLLEPESDDGLTDWNFTDPWLEVGKAAPVRKIMVVAPLKVRSLK